MENWAFPACFKNCFQGRREGDLNLTCACKDFKSKTFSVFKSLHGFVPVIWFCLLPFWRGNNILRRGVKFW